MDRLKKLEEKLSDEIEKQDFQTKFILHEFTKQKSIKGIDNLNNMTDDEFDSYVKQQREHNKFEEELAATQPIARTTELSKQLLLDSNEFN